MSITLALPSKGRLKDQALKHMADAGLPAEIRGRADARKDAAGVLLDDVWAGIFAAAASIAAAIGSELRLASPIPGSDRGFRAEVAVAPAGDRLGTPLGGHDPLAHRVAARARRHMGAAARRVGAGRLRGAAGASSHGIGARLRRLWRRLHRRLAPLAMDDRETAAGHMGPDRRCGRRRCPGTSRGTPWERDRSAA